MSALGLAVAQIIDAPGRAVGLVDGHASRGVDALVVAAAQRGINVDRSVPRRGLIERVPRAVTTRSAVMSRPSVDSACTSFRTAFLISVRLYGVTSVSMIAVVVISSCWASSRMAADPVAPAPMSRMRVEPGMVELRSE